MARSTRSSRFSSAPKKSARGSRKRSRYPWKSTERDGGTRTLEGKAVHLWREPRAGGGSQPRHGDRATVRGRGGRKLAACRRAGGARPGGGGGRVDGNGGGAGGERARRRDEPRRSAPGAGRSATPVPIRFAGGFALARQREKQPASARRARRNSGPAQPGRDHPIRTCSR